MGAGIFPITFIKGSIFVLMGKDQYNNLWSDFGGGKNGSEDHFTTAIREGYEELDGLLGNKKELKKNVQSNIVNVYATKDYSYYSYVFLMNELDCINLIKLFNNHRKFIEENNLIVDKEGFYEKTELKLFSCNDLIDYRNQIRPFFTEITDKILFEYS